MGRPVTFSPAEGSTRLVECADVFVGLQTSADKVLVVPAEFDIESEITRPFVLTGSLCAYSHLQASAICQTIHRTSILSRHRPRQPSRRRRTRPHRFLGGEDAGPAPAVRGGENRARTNRAGSPETATDAQLDRFVYDLYGLTEDEIKLVEGA